MFALAVSHFQISHRQSMFIVQASFVSNLNLVFVKMGKHGFVKMGNCQRQSLIHRHGKGWKQRILWGQISLNQQVASVSPFESDSDFETCPASSTSGVLVSLRDLPSFRASLSALFSSSSEEEEESLPFTPNSCAR